MLEDFNKQYPKQLKYCDNEIVNTVLALKSSQIDEAGIKPEIEMLSAFSSSPYSDLELSSILTNLIDNAIRGTEKYNGEKRIKIAVGIKQNQFVILVENTTDEAINIDSTKTTKTASGKHGLGLKIIKKTVNKNGGTFTIKNVNNVVKALAVTEIAK